MADIHTCSYYCTRPECIKTQRDELRDRLEAQPPRPVKGDPMLDAVLDTPNPQFDAWVKSLPPAYWARYDLSACRIGFEAGAAPQQQSNIGNGHDDWARKHYDEAQQQAEPPRLPNNDEVICPACCHQFRAIPVNVQAELAALKKQQAEPQMPIMRVTVSNGVAVHGTFYAPGLPDGEHDLFCAPCLPSGQWEPSMFAEQQAEPVAFADEHVDTFLTQYNDVYCHQRKAGVGGGNAERAAMRQVLILALGAYKPHITAEQVKQIKRLASLLETRVRAVYVLADDDEDRESLNDDVAETRAALHAALDALVLP